jgi:cellulose synthase/poly-beta-1,6-N-acetylglucosamine synthase-like glycosyltransferase
MKPGPGDCSTSTEANRGDTGFPLVSIIVPTRNSGRYLSVCVCSIQKQDYPNVELLVVDRDSTDSTFEKALTNGATVLTVGTERSA